MPRLNPLRKPARDWTLALAVAAAALLLAWLLTPWIGWHAALLVTQPAIVFTAVTWGRAPATLVLLVGVAHAAVAFAPAGQWVVNGLADGLTLVAYASIGALLILYCGRLHLRGGRAERAEQRLSLAQDETGVGLFELDYRAGTAYASPALCQILGQPVMNDGSMPLQQWLTALGAGHVDESFRTVQQKVAAGELRYERELRIQRPDGEEHWLLSRIRLELDADGELATARGATLDITARKQLLTELERAKAQLQKQLDDMSRLHSLREQALSLARDAQRRFEVALHSSSVAFTILAPVHDADGRLIDFVWTYANPAAATLIGQPAQRLIGQRVVDVLPHAWDEPGFFERYVQVSETGCTAEFETCTPRPGAMLWLHVILSPLNGSVVVWFADITQRRAQQQALQDADRRKDQFLATLAHELRNPLAPIRHAAAIVRSTAASAAQRDWSLSVIERQLQQMALLLDDLLDVSRITRGTLPLRRARSALRPVLETAIETARPLFGAREHRLEVDLPDAPVWLEVDPLRIAQVVGNLLVNAAKYTEPGGVVRVGARREGDDVLISVTDTGRGLRPEDCERVFEMFTQIPADDGGMQGGLGIGLALARNLVELHGGRLDASSPGPGRGSTFTARLPVSPDSEAGATVPAADAPRPTPMRRRILVADDNRDAADSLALLLGMEGHDVQVAYNGGEALALYRSFRPQVALLDLGMPEHSGTEVAALIRRQQQDDAITLVAITGFGQPRDRLAALEAGFDHHLTKPIEFDQLQSLIDGMSTPSH